MVMTPALPLHLLGQTGIAIGILTASELALVAGLAVVLVSDILLIVLNPAKSI
jgi:hypothetical protein